MANETNKSAKAVQLLMEVTMLLLNGNDTQQEEKREGQEQPQVPPEVAIQPQGQHAMNRDTVAPGQVGASNVLNNFRRIFAPYQRPSRVPLKSTFQPRLRTQSKPKTKQIGSFFQPKETWTHEFFCLGLKTQERAPSRAEKFELQECGLGRKKICFHSKAKFTDIQEKLEEEFPKLKTGGGFVILRTGREGSNNLLSVIPPPTTGYSVPFLRDCSGLGQALAYVRPLQRDLDRSPLPKVRFFSYMGTNWKWK